MRDLQQHLTEPDTDERHSKENKQMRKTNYMTVDGRSYSVPEGWSDKPRGGVEQDVYADDFFDDSFPDGRTDTPPLIERRLKTFLGNCPTNVDLRYNVTTSMLWFYTNGIAGLPIPLEKLEEFSEQLVKTIGGEWELPEERELEDMTPEQLRKELMNARKHIASLRSDLSHAPNLYPAKKKRKTKRS